MYVLAWGWVGGEWVRGLGLAFTNTVVTVGRASVFKLGWWCLGQCMGWCYVCVCYESGLFV